MENRAKRLERLSALVALVQAELVELRELPVDDDPDLSLKEIWARHHIGRDAILGAEARGELKLTRKTGREKIYVRQSVLDAWVTSGQSVHRTAPDDGDAERERQLKAYARGAA